MSGFIYPNEVILEWDLLIVIYPFITGLVAGSFIVSSLYHIFGISSLKPIAKFSLITSLAFLLVCPLPLVLHLGHPERAFEMFLRPNLISAMSAFGYIWFFYLIIVVAEVWLVFRKDILNRFEQSQGVKKSVYSILTLGVKETSEKSWAADAKLIKLFALIGVPAACLLHGYVGFIFGAIKANPWWSTPLMPIIFLISAIVSGIALLMVLYVLITKFRRKQLDTTCLRSLSLWLGGFLTLAFALESLEVLTMFYESEESWEMVFQLIINKLLLSYVGIQFIMGSVLPLIILGITETVTLKESFKIPLRFLSASLVLVGVMAMRWNVVIGGQLLSKSFHGLTDFVPSLYGSGGFIAAAGMLILPFIVLTIFTLIIPPWLEEPEHVAFNRLKQGYSLRKQG